MMIAITHSFLLLLLLGPWAATTSIVNGFVLSNNNGPQQKTRSTQQQLYLSASTQQDNENNVELLDDDDNNEDENDWGMTPELKKVTNAFAIIQEEQTRYKQLLYMAQSTKEANNLPESSKILENKVPGCLSTVYIDGSAIYNKDIDDYVINFLGDSDGLMTKGLVALLVRCLSGNTAKAIQNVDPQFIKIARIDQSLTPGRNNGFLNMLQSMKNKALSLDEAARRREKEEGTAGSESTSSSSSTTEDEESSSTSTDVNNNNNSSETNGSSSDDDDDDDDDEEGGPKYKAIVQSLQALKPTSLQLDDNSDQYDNNDSDDSESHFGLYIVAPAFDGLNVIKRQQLIYMILGDLMPQIEALQITSLTPDEEAEQQSA